MLRAHAACRMLLRVAACVAAWAQHDAPWSLVRLHGIPYLCLAHAILDLLMLLHCNVLLLCCAQLLMAVSPVSQLLAP